MAGTQSVAGIEPGRLMSVINVHFPETSSLPAFGRSTTRDFDEASRLYS